LSIIEKNDVKNHLSSRFCTKIHLCPPASRPDATGFSHEKPAGADTMENDSLEQPLNLSSTSGRKPMAIVARRSAQN